MSFYHACSLPTKNLLALPMAKTIAEANAVIIDHPLFNVSDYYAVKGEELLFKKFAEIPESKEEEDDLIRQKITKALLSRKNIICFGAAALVLHIVRGGPIYFHSDKLANPATNYPIFHIGQLGKKNAHPVSIVRAKTDQIVKPPFGNNDNFTPLAFSTHSKERFQTSMTKGKYYHQSNGRLNQNTLYTVDIEAFRWELPHKTRALGFSFIPTKANRDYILGMIDKHITKQTKEKEE